MKDAACPPAAECSPEEGGEPNYYHQQSQQLLNIPYLYPYQHLLIDYVLRAAGQRPGPIPARTLLALLPTGAGKSVCFTLPALLLSRPSLIIYPLRSLIFDQQRRLQEQGIAHALLVGGQNPKQRRAQWELLRSGQVKLLLSNPETLLQSHTQRQLANFSFGQIVLDEAHTLVEWGESFRPAYLELSQWLRQRSELLCAYTATASPRIKRGLEQRVLGENYYLVQANADRPNIYYRSLPCLCKAQVVLDLVDQCARPLLIFCAQRASCESLALLIRLSRSQIDCRYYHAGLSVSEKAEVERWFFASNNGVLVATCAYGMGVDKANIRSVLHYHLPTTVEAYLQESGRAGRDRSRAEAILLYDAHDLRQTSAALPYHLAKLAADGSNCRRQALLGLLGQEGEFFCAGCDVCSGSFQNKPQHWSKLRTILRRYRLGLDSVCDFLQGHSGVDMTIATMRHHPHFGSYRHWPQEHLQQALQAAADPLWR